MKEQKLEYIADFLNNPKVFFEQLSDYGVFNKEEFHRYTKTVFDLNELDLTVNERFIAAVRVWEISYRIQSYLHSHLDPNDFISINNLKEDDIRQISNILYYTANWFSYRKQMDKNSITIGSWV